MMSKEQRRSQRVTISLTVRIMLRDNKSGSNLAEAVGRVDDISRHGLRLTVPQIKAGSFHLFYAFNDNETRTLHLEIQAEEAEGRRWEIPARPVWFDHLLSEPGKPFQLGMEFLCQPEDEAVEWLNRLVATRKRRQSWLGRLFS